MRRISAYLKPYLLLLVTAVVLLFAQANLDLALPDYMSRIVNVGIQQGGVSDAVPETVRSSTMERLTLFMSDDDSELVLKAYELVSASSTTYDTYTESYPDLQGEAVYRLIDTSGNTREALNPVMARAFLAVGAVTAAVSGGDPADDRSAEKDAETSPDTRAGGMPPEMAASLARLPEGADVFALFRQLPENGRLALVDAITERFETMEGSTLVQAAAVQVKAEYVAMGANAARIQSAYILRTGLVMLLISLGAGVTTVIVGFLSARVAAGLSRDLRSAVFERVESFSNHELDKFSTASLITRSTNDIMQIQMVSVILIRMVFYAPIIGVGGIIRAVGKSSSMWWVIAVAVGALSILVVAVYKIAVPKFKLMQKLMDRLNLVSRDSLAGMMVIRAFNMQQHEENRFDEANEDLTSTTLFVNRVMVVMMPFMMFVMNGLSLLIVWVGAHHVAEASIQVGDMMAFLQYAMQIVMAFLMLSMMFIMLPRAQVSANRVADVLETDPSIVDPPKPEEYDRSAPATVEFQNVSFRYPHAEADVLHDLNFTAKPGQTTAIIGATGSGKSTIVNLIPRFYDVSEGRVLVCGKDVRTVDQHGLRDRIGYVPQKPTLFSGTIQSNLRYANDNADDEALWASARVAQADDFINAGEQKMEAPIAQSGMNVSGGQKQRLSIARALVKNPPIYIFDDSFSALDFKTDSQLRRALRETTATATVIVVTQRVSTAINADQIIVLDEGRIVGQGSHRELMDSCKTYREIATSQLSMEELA